ncbi:hypothetical protein QAD02_012805 [Eretmocerus hayati]|uniref:Uncharacterized protein n=1 Tax=Eretmocerus hayati TaxID=131215 RepID=A0ACC2P0P2_9HYME|nr:hypothetical protein QAD02_012805 [Eretmocerus hayati]
MPNSDSNGVSSRGGPIKLLYNVPSRQRENQQHERQAKNHQEIQCQDDDLKLQIELSSDKPTISVRDYETIRGKPSNVHQTLELTAGYGSQAKTSRGSALSQERGAREYDAEMNASLGVNDESMQIDLPCHPPGVEYDLDGEFKRF